MGYALAMSGCLCCGNTFGYNPVRVPSFRVAGTRRPICKRCMGIINDKRKAAGVEPFVIPDDAYEACDEGELE